MIILDIETTGSDQNKCSIVNIGAIDFENPSNRFFEECCVPDIAFIDNFVLSYNGYNLEEIKNSERKSHKEMLKDLFLWLSEIEDRTFAGQNIRFDVNFLYVLAERLGENNEVFGKRFVDLHSVCYAHMTRRGLKVPVENNVSGLNTDKVMSYVGIPSEPKPHKQAITGAIYETEAFSRLLKGKNLLEEFKEYPLPKYLK
jgi:DNA polymerase III epsilon subunit-like protein